MTPEEFLAQQAALENIDEALAPMCEMIARVRKSFIDEAGVGEAAADLLTVEWCRTFLFPMLRSPAPA